MITRYGLLWDYQICVILHLTFCVWLLPTAFHEKASVNSFEWATSSGRSYDYPSLKSSHCLALSNCLAEKTTTLL